MVDRFWTKSYSRLLVSIAIIGFLLMYGLASVVDPTIRNFVMLTLIDMQPQASINQLWQYPRLDLHSTDTSSNFASRWLVQASTGGYASDVSKWSLARIALAHGNYAFAADLLISLQYQIRNNPLLYEDALLAFAYGGHPALATTMFAEHAFPFRPLTARMGEGLAYAYLQQAIQDDLYDPEMLNLTLSIRPYDLAANYYAWQAATADNDPAYVELLLQQLRNEASLPQDRPLWEYTLPVVVAMAKQGLWSSEKLSSLAAYLTWEYHDTEKAVVVLEELVDQLPDQVSIRYYLGDAYYRIGEVSKARAEYEQVVERSPNTVSVYERLGMLARVEARQATTVRVSSLKQAAFWYSLHSLRVPQDLIVIRHLIDVCAQLETWGQITSECDTAAQSLTTLSQSHTAAQLLQGMWLRAIAETEPTIMLNQELPSGWILEGVTVDEARLLRNEPSDFLLFWKGEWKEIPDDQSGNWYKAGDRWIQFIPQVRNLVIGGSFELGMGHEGHPIGAWFDIYGRPPSLRKLVSDRRERSPTTVARLQNRAEYNYSSYATVSRTPHSKSYLQSGWVRSDSGSGWIGMAWFQTSGRDLKRDETYLITHYDVSEWQRFTGVVDAVDGATTMQLWLLNHYATGNVYFDDVWLVEIGSHP